MSIEINQRIIIVGIGNNARYNIPIHEGTVKTIGRKWFTVEIPDAPYIARDNKFSLEDGRCDGKGYASQWRVYESEQLYEEDIEKPKLLINAQRLLYKLSFAELKELNDKLQKL